MYTLPPPPDGSRDDDASQSDPFIAPDKFRSLISGRANRLYMIARGMTRPSNDAFALTRPLLSEVIAESTQLEELLDAYGARNNSMWHRFRARIAALKNFGRGGYELLHLQHACRRHAFVAGAEGFEDATGNALDYVARLIYCELTNWVIEAKRLGLDAPISSADPAEFDERLPMGRLPRDRKTGHDYSVEERVVRLATNFLHGTEGAAFIGKATRKKPDQYTSLVSDILTEENLRAQEVNFHNLQSLYDTYVSDSDTEHMDEDLPRLREHISVILHLLRVATIFVHFYERHVLLKEEAIFCREGCCLTAEDFFHVLVDYLLTYANRFLGNARTICQRMLKRYAEIVTTDVPAPVFFGFHVRPSALVSRIVSHYGSDVVMVIGNNEYDAAETMRLFSANEYINQKKREFIFGRLGQMDLESIRDAAETHDQAIRHTLMELAEQQLIRILRRPLPLDDAITKSDASFREKLRETISSLNASRMINIEYQVHVTFRGDKRVLDDIAILAKHGYGENEFGDDVPLPPELSYLGHGRKF